MRLDYDENKPEIPVIAGDLGNAGVQTQFRRIFADKCTVSTQTAVGVVSYIIVCHGLRFRVADVSVIYHVAYRSANLDPIADRAVCFWRLIGTDVCRG